MQILRARSIGELDNPLCNFPAVLRREEEQDFVMVEPFPNLLFPVCAVPVSVRDGANSSFVQPCASRSSNLASLQKESEPCSNKFVGEV